MPVGIHVTSQGLELTFTEAMDAATAQDAKNYAVKTWGLTRSEKYGSPKTDERTLPVSDARLSPDGKTIALEIPAIQPTACMEINVSIRGADGTPITRRIHNTVHTLK